MQTRLADPALLPQDGGSPPGAAGHAVLLQELQLHQQELESQNVELRRTQLELAAARDRYRDLYDRAPVGYVTLDAEGRVIESNLTAASLLGEAPEALLRRRLSAFIAPQDGDRWHQHRTFMLKHDTMRRIELSLQRSDGQGFDGQLCCRPMLAAGESPVLLVTLTDITERRQAEADRRAARHAVASREAERRRVSRELHEDLGQRLSALKMNLATLAPETATPDERIDGMLLALGDTVATVRRMATELRPPMLDDLGLSAAVDWLARQSARRHGLALTLHLAARDPPLGEAVSVTMYRVLQESLTHVTGQPDTTGVVIELREECGALVLKVQGQLGVRSRPGRTTPRPETWRALRDSAHLLGYQFDVDMAADGAERVTVRLPVSGLREGEPGVDLVD